MRRSRVARNRGSLKAVLKGEAWWQEGRRCVCGGSKRLRVLVQRARTRYTEEGGGAGEE